jgi:hypothetical protein
MLQRILRRLALPAVVLAATGCQELEVTNPNDPERSRALSDANAVQSLVLGAFDAYFDAIHGLGNGRNLFFVYGSNFDYTSSTGQTTLLSAEPRPEFPNDEQASVLSPSGHESLWDALYGAWSLGDDVVRVLTRESNPVEIVLEPADVGRAGCMNPALDDAIEFDQTQCTLAFALIVQGLALGQAANLYDRAFALNSRTDPFPETPDEVLAVFLEPADAVEVAIEVLEDAKQVLADNPGILYPSRTDAGADIWFGTPTAVGPAELTAMINSHIARFLVLNARGPGDRDGTSGAPTEVDWNRVQMYANEGVTADFDLVVDSDRDLYFYGLIQRNSAFTPGAAIDNRLIGMADTTGAYQNWVMRAPDDPLRVGFDIGTPDRRIMGPNLATYTSSVRRPEPGAYVRYMYRRNCCTPSPYRTGHYQWFRHQHEQGNWTLTGVTSTAAGGENGINHMVSVDQNRLYLAEAAYYLSGPAAAVPLIDVTRTRSHALGAGMTVYPGLPPLSPTGAEHSAVGRNNCVPRTDAGQCGDVLVALRYERMLENLGTDWEHGFLDSRGFGMLPDDSFIQIPVPALELALMEQPVITFGGPSDPLGATYDPVGGANPSPNP